MKEHPILFTGEMVRAILDGRKTQTRRLVEPQPEPIPEEVWKDRSPSPHLQFWWPCRACQSMIEIREMRGFAPYAVGDRLWVRETWQVRKEFDHLAPRDLPDEAIRNVNYLADGDKWDARVRSSLHIERRASRITLEVTGVRVERVQEISEEDEEKEGIRCPNRCYGGWINSGPDGGYQCPHPLCGEPNAFFRLLWDSINAKRGHPWANNDWVWAYEFVVAEVRR